MTDPRQLRKKDYEEIPGQVVVTATASYTLSGSRPQTSTNAEMQNSSSVAFRRTPPTYNSVNEAREAAILDGIVGMKKGKDEHPLQPVAGPSSATENATRNTYNVSDDFVIEGYENVSYEQTHFPPPPLELPSADADSSLRRGNATVPHIDDAAARDAVLSYASQHLCWGISAARDMTILDITPSSAFRYNLETCTEKRTAAWVFEPYTGQVIDSVDRGPSPKPWDVLVVPPNPFRDGQVVIEVPHSARIVDCHDCGTLGRRRCWSCFGNGEIHCTACNGTGKLLESGGPTEAERSSASAPKPCYHCNAGGQRRCAVCLGPGQLPCKTCLARGQLKHSIQLTVSWKVYKTDRIVEHTAMPESLIRSVQGRIAFDEEKAAVWPINFFPDEAVNHASREILDEHRARLSAEKTISQRQSVQIVPIYQVAYAWRNHRGFYYIYSHDNTVYFPDYPQKKLCGVGEMLGCTIL